MRSRARQAAHTLTTYTATRALLGGLTVLIISRILGPEGRGQYTVLLTVVTVATALGRLSVDQSQVTLWPVASARAAIAANGLLLGAVVGGAAALVAERTVTALGPRVVPLPGHALLALALLAVPCNVVAQYLSAVLVLRGRIEAVNWAGLFGAVVQVTALVLLAAAARLSIGWAVAVSTACAALVPVALVRVVRPRPRACDLRLALREVTLGLRYHPGLVSWFLLLRLDVLILNALTSAAAVGRYALAVSLMELTRVAADSIAQTALSEQATGEARTAAAFTVRVTRLSALVSLCSVGVMCAVAPFLVPVVFGRAFDGAVGPLLALAPGLWALGVTRPVNAFLLLQNRPMRMSAMYAVALAVNVAGNLALIPGSGAVGAAVTASVSYMLLAAMQVGWLVRATGTPCRLLLPRGADVARLVAAAGSVWAAGRSLARARQS